MSYDKINDYEILSMEFDKKIAEITSLRTRLQRVEELETKWRYHSMDESGKYHDNVAELFADELRAALAEKKEDNK